MLQLRCATSDRRRRWSCRAGGVVQRSSSRAAPRPPGRRLGADPRRHLVHHARRTRTAWDRPSALVGHLKPRRHRAQRPDGAGGTSWYDASTPHSPRRLLRQRVELSDAGRYTDTEAGTTPWLARCPLLEERLPPRTCFSIRNGRTSASAWCPVRVSGGTTVHVRGRPGQVRDHASPDPPTSRPGPAQSRWPAAWPSVRAGQGPVPPATSTTVPEQGARHAAAAAIAARCLATPPGQRREQADSQLPPPEQQARASGGQPLWS